MFNINESLTGMDKNIDKAIRNHLINVTKKSIADIKAIRRAMIQDKNKNELQYQDSVTLKELLRQAKEALDNSRDNDPEMIDYYEDEVKQRENELKQAIERENKEKVEPNFDPKNPNNITYDKIKFTELGKDIKTLELKIKKLEKEEKSYSYEEIGGWTKEYINRNFDEFNFDDFSNFLMITMGKGFAKELQKVKKLTILLAQQAGLTFNKDKVNVNNFVELFPKILPYLQNIYKVNKNFRKQLAELWSDDLKEYLRDFSDINSSILDEFILSYETAMRFTPKRETAVNLGKYDGAALGVALEKSFIKFAKHVIKNGELSNFNSSYANRLKNDNKNSLNGLGTSEYLTSLYLIVKRYAADFGGPTANYNEDHTLDKIVDTTKNVANEPIDFIFNGVPISLKRHTDGSMSAKILDYTDNDKKLEELASIITILQGDNVNLSNDVWVAYDDSGDIVSVRAEEFTMNKTVVKKYPLKRTIQNFIKIAFRVPHHMMMVHKTYVIFLNLTNILKNIDLNSFVYPPNNHGAYSRRMTSKNLQRLVDLYFKFNLKKAADMVIYRIEDQVKMTRLKNNLTAAQVSGGVKWSSDIDKVRSSKIIQKLDKGYGVKRYKIKSMIMRIATNHDKFDRGLYAFRLNMNLSMVNHRLMEKFIPSYSDVIQMPSQINEFLNFKQPSNPSYINPMKNFLGYLKNYRNLLSTESKTTLSRKIYKFLISYSKKFYSGYKKLAYSTPEKENELLTNINDIRKEFYDKRKFLENNATESIKRLNSSVESNYNVDRTEKIANKMENIHSALSNLRKFNV